jgi:hypothetical protein
LTIMDHVFCFNLQPLKAFRKNYVIVAAAPLKPVEKSEISPIATKGNILLTLNIIYRRNSQIFHATALSLVRRRRHIQQTK